LIAFLKLPATSKKPRLRSGTSNKSSATTSKEGTGIASGTEAEATVTFEAQGASSRLYWKNNSVVVEMSKKTSTRKFTAEDLWPSGQGDLILSLHLIQGNRLTFYQNKKTELGLARQVKTKPGKQLGKG